MPVNDFLTSVLDAVALLAIAAGVAAGSAQWLGWWGISVGGVVLTAGSALSTWRSGRAAGE